MYVAPLYCTHTPAHTQVVFSQTDTDTHARCFLAEGTSWELNYLLGQWGFFWLFFFFLGCHTRRGCQISNQISLSGGYSGINKHFAPTASQCHPLPYHSLVFSAKPRRGCVCGCREWTNTGCADTMAILHLGTQWENYPISHLCRSVEGVHFYKVDSVTPK